jgi:hypothetical protein
VSRWRPVGASGERGGAELWRSGHSCASRSSGCVEGGPMRRLGSGTGEHRAALCGAAAGGARRGQACTWARRSSRRCGLTRSPTTLCSVRACAQAGRDAAGWRRRRGGGARERQAGSGGCHGGAPGTRSACADWLGGARGVSWRGRVARERAAASWRRRGPGVVRGLGARAGERAMAWRGACHGSGHWAQRARTRAVGPSAVRARTWAGRAAWTLGRSGARAHGRLRGVAGACGREVRRAQGRRAGLGGRA